MARKIYKTEWLEQDLDSDGDEVYVRDLEQHRDNVLICIDGMRAWVDLPDEAPYQIRLVISVCDNGEWRIGKDGVDLLHVVDGTEVMTYTGLDEWLQDTLPSGDERFNIYVEYEA